MVVYGKTAANAIAVMSYLADSEGEMAGSAEIGEARRIPRPLTAKLLTRLASAGLVAGQPGPGGGYRLAKDPGGICLLDIVCLFEQTEPTTICPFGHYWCGTGAPCPLHDRLRALEDEKRHFLEDTFLSVFVST